MSKKPKPPIEKICVPAPVKLSLLWASLMALFIYNDYLAMYSPGMIEMMSDGSMGPLGKATGRTMLAVAFVMALPASMVFLSSTLPSRISRGLNMIVGPLYLVIAALTLFGSPLWYQLIVAVEIVATFLIVWIAARWPRQDDRVAAA